MIPLNPDYVAARSLRSLRSKNLQSNKSLAKIKENCTLDEVRSATVRHNLTSYNLMCEYPRTGIPIQHGRGD